VRGGEGGEDREVKENEILTLFQAVQKLLAGLEPQALKALQQYYQLAGLQPPAI
jgi:hypothetical protein